MSTCNECDIYFYYRNKMGIIEKKQETGLISESYYWYSTEDAFKQLFQMSNPYVYAESGITELDINAYEHANAVPSITASVKSYVDSLVYNMDYSSVLPDISEFKGIKEVVTQKHQCHCDSMELFRHGCKCGGI